MAENAKLSGKTRKRKRGRPKLPASQGKRASFGTRIRPQLKQRLEQEASRAGRSLSEEIEYRLEKSLWEDVALYEQVGGRKSYDTWMNLAAYVAAKENFESLHSDSTLRPFGDSDDGQWHAPDFGPMVSDELAELLRSAQIKPKVESEKSARAVSHKRKASSRAISKRN